ncbi:MAG: MgtC/SapB family protein, partial [Thermomicrobiales bacterium]
MTVIDLSNTDAAIRVVIALFLGALVGLEREWRNKPAGLRTYALVCEGSALFMIGSILLYDEVQQHGGTTADPSR